LIILEKKSTMKRKILAGAAFALVLT